MGPARGRLTPRMRAWPKTAAGIAVVVALFWWVFRGVDAAEVWTRIRDADFFLLFLAVATTTAGFLVRAVRWRYLLAPAQPSTPLRSRFAAVCVGFMVNNLLPRVGEVARAYSYSRLEPVSATTAFATLVVERFLDGVAVLLLLFVAVASPGFPAEDLPPQVTLGIRSISGLVLVVLAGSVAMVALPNQSTHALGWFANRLLPPRWAAKAETAAAGFVAGFAALRGWRLLVPAIVWSVAFWALQSLSFWIGFFAFGIELPYTAALFLNAAVAVAVTIPTPGYFGTFQAGSILALRDVYGAAEAPALGFAVGWHLGAFVPITLMGLWYARRIGVSIGEMGAGRPRNAGGGRAEMADEALGVGRLAGDASAEPAESNRLAVSVPFSEPDGSGEHGERDRHGARGRADR